MSTYPRGAVSRFGASAIAHASGLTPEGVIRSIKRFSAVKNEYENLKKEFKRQRTSSAKKTIKSKTMGSYGKGFFKGIIGVPKSNPVVYEEKALTFGAGSVLENYGKAQGTEIVWIGGTTLNLEHLATNVAKAILRKLFKQAGNHITNADVNLQSQVTTGAGAANGMGFRVLRVLVDNTGASLNNYYETVTGETLSTVAVNCGLVDEIKNFATAQTNGWSNMIRLYQMDYTQGDNVGRLVATLNMNNEMVHYTSKVKLVVQNRTKGATGTGDALDVVDAQPLKGMMYYFKKGNPIVREQPGTTAPPNTNSIMSRWTGDSVVLYSDSTTGYDAQIRNPPPAHFFQNCSKSSKITLEPGDLKETNLYNQSSKYYGDFLRSLNWITAGSGFRRQKCGDSVLIALEERLNSGSANPIVVNYECETQITAYITTNRIDPIVKHFEVNQISM